MVCGLSDRERPDTRELVVCLCTLISLYGFGLWCVCVLYCECVHLCVRGCMLGNTLLTFLKVSLWSKEHGSKLNGKTVWFGLTERKQN